MTLRLRRAFARALTVGALLAGVVAPETATAQAVADEDAFRSFVEGVQSGALPPALAIRECQRELEGQEEVDNVRQIMAGYLEVREAEALGVFCESLVRAVESDGMTAETAAVLGRQQMDAGFFQAFGRLLRAVHFARHLPATGSAAGN